MNLNPPASEGLIPPGALVGRQFFQICLAILRRRWTLLGPVAALIAMAVAIADTGLAVWVYGDATTAAKYNFDPSAKLLELLKNQTSAHLVHDAWRIVATVTVTALVLPTIATIAAASVVDDVEQLQTRNARVYLGNALQQLPRALGISLLATVVAAAPLLITLVLAGTLFHSHVAQLVTLFILGFPSFAWLVFCSVRLSLSIQVLAMEGAGLIAALRRSWTLTRGQLVRVFAISIATSFIAAIAGSLIAGPITLVGTLAGAGQESLGARVAAHFLNTSVTNLISVSATGIVAALLLIDLRRRAQGFGDSAPQT